MSPCTSRVSTRVARTRCSRSSRILKTSKETPAGSFCQGATRTEARRSVEANGRRDPAWGRGANRSLVNARTTYHKQITEPPCRSLRYRRSGADSFHGVPLTGLPRSRGRPDANGPGPGAEVGRGSRQSTRRILARRPRRRRGDLGAVSGEEAGVLIQNGGQNWRELRSGPIMFYGGSLIIAVLIAIIAKHIVAGKEARRAPAGRSRRWRMFERVMHWYVADPDLSSWRSPA